LVRNDAAGAPTLVDLGAGIPVVTGGLLTIAIWCPAAGTSIWLRAVNDLTGTVFEQEVTPDRRRCRHMGQSRVAGGFVIASGAECIILPPAYAFSPAAAIVLR